MTLTTERAGVMFEQKVAAFVDELNTICDSFVAHAEATDKALQVGDIVLNGTTPIGIALESCVLTSGTASDELITAMSRRDEVNAFYKQLYSTHRPHPTSWQCDYCRNRWPMDVWICPTCAGPRTVE